MTRTKHGSRGRKGGRKGAAEGGGGGRGGGAFPKNVLKELRKSGEARDVRGAHRDVQIALAKGFHYGGGDADRDVLSKLISGGCVEAALGCLEAVGENKFSPGAASQILSSLPQCFPVSPSIGGTLVDAVTNASDFQGGYPWYSPRPGCIDMHPGPPTCSRFHRRSMIRNLTRFMGLMVASMPGHPNQNVVGHTFRHGRDGWHSSS